MSFFIRKAFEYTSKAKELELKGRVVEAARLYEEALRFARKALEYETDPQMRAVCEEIIARIEVKLAELGSQRTPVPVSAPPPSTPMRLSRPAAGPVRVERVPGPSRPVGELEKLEEEAFAKARTFITKADVTWDDIADLESVKRELISAIFFSLAQPEEHVEVEVPRRFLLYGPPGTGKTLLAMAASNMLKATFFNVPISGVLSRYVGDSPKIIAAVFELARRMAPSVIFFDEIDALAVKREVEGTHVPGLLQTLLTELDGFKSKRMRQVIIVIAATNKPWMLDEAILSRFDRKIYVPPPDKEARKQLFKLHLEKRGFRIEGITYDELAELTEGYTGRDIANVCRIAVMKMLQRANPEITKILETVKDANELRRMKYKVLPITREELLQAIKEVKPSVTKEELEKYEKWAKQHEV